MLSADAGYRGIGSQLVDDGFVSPIFDLEGFVQPENGKYGRCNRETNDGMPRG